MPNSEEKIGNDQSDLARDLLPGTFDDDAVTRGLLGDAIKKCGRSRDQIAERMSWLLSRPITPNMLNDFTADSKVNHRFPFAWCRAFCESTSDWRLLKYIAEQAGFVLLHKEDSDICSLGEMVIEQERAKGEVKRLARNIIKRRAQR